MSAVADEERAVTGRVDADGRLIAADPLLAALNERAGGSVNGPLSVPQIATLARLARRLGITISRAAIAADGDRDVDLWVRATPQGEEVALSISGWGERTPSKAPAAEREREADFTRAAADWTWETDESLRITSLSAAAAAAIGRPGEELIGKQMTRLFRFRESVDGSLPILAALANHQPFSEQAADLRAGRKGRYYLSAVPLIDGSGRFAGFSGSAASRHGDDAPAPTPTGEVPSSGAFGERLDAALRRPLVSIVEHADKIRAQPEGPLRRDYAGYASDIASAGRHLLALVDDLVDLQAIERSDFTPASEAIDLADVARRAAGLLAVRASERQVRIDMPAADETAPATGDFTRALQILMNLITNAVRYTPEGGQVWIRTEREGDIVAVIVADQGKGVAPADQERMFEKFERLDPSEPGGTGLGLYIARRLARAMGGDIGIDSAPGQGARFTFTLRARD
jgi:signal transduction histidine kinase